jgi:hypothetical protein
MPLFSFIFPSTPPVATPPAINQGMSPAENHIVQSACHSIMSVPDALLDAEPGSRVGVLGELVTLLNTARPNAGPPAHAVKNAALASLALGRYLVAGFMRGNFSEKLNELLSVNLDPFFQWTEQGVVHSLLDAVMHFGASDCALLLAERGIGHGYLSLPLIGPKPIAFLFGDRGERRAFTWLARTPSCEQGGYCLAHVLAQYGSLSQLKAAASNGLDFSHSAYNVPHPVVLAALHGRSENVQYFLENEEVLHTVKNMLKHSLSKAYVTNAYQRELPMLQQINVYAAEHYPNLFL